EPLRLQGLKPIRVFSELRPPLRHEAHRARRSIRDDAGAWSAGQGDCHAYGLTSAAGPAMVNCRVEGTPITAMASNRGHRLRLEDISHRFGDVVAVRDIDLDIAGGELVALLGPSGCGKSTLLRIVSGFIRQSSGRVLFDGEAVDHLPPSRRGAGIV